MEKVTFVTSFIVTFSILYVRHLYDIRLGHSNNLEDHVVVGQGLNQILM